MNLTLYKRCQCATRPKCDHPWWFKFMHRGTLHQQSTRLSNGKAALRQAHHRRTELINTAEGLPVATEAVGRVTLQTLATRYVEFHLSHFPRSYSNAKRAVEHFVRITGAERDIRTITPGDIERFRATRLTEPGNTKGSTVARSSIRTETLSIRSLFRQAAKWYRGVKSPWTAGVAEWQVDEEEMQIATPDEVRRCLTELPPPFNLFCEITYRVLPRISEVLALRRDDVGITIGRDGQATGFLKRRLKGGRQKRVGIPLRLAERLLAQVTSDDQELLFPDHADSDTISSCFRRLFDGLGYPHLHHHVFRHTGITRMMDAGVNNNAIKELAGWSSLRQLARYGHVSDAERDRAANVNAVEVDAPAAAVAATTTTATTQMARTAPHRTQAPARLAAP